MLDHLNILLVVELLLLELLDLGPIIEHMIVERRWALGWHLILMWYSRGASWTHSVLVLSLHLLNRKG